MQLITFVPAKDRAAFVLTDDEVAHAISGRFFDACSSAIGRSDLENLSSIERNGFQICVIDLLLEEVRHYRRQIAAYELDLRERESDLRTKKLELDRQVWNERHILSDSDRQDLDDGGDET